MNDPRTLWDDEIQITSYCILQSKHLIWPLQLLQSWQLRRLECPQSKCQQRTYFNSSLDISRLWLCDTNAASKQRHFVSATMFMWHTHKKKEKHSATLSPPSSSSSSLSWSMATWSIILINNNNNNHNHNHNNNNDNDNDNNNNNIVDFGRNVHWHLTSSSDSQLSSSSCHSSWVYPRSVYFICWLLGVCMFLSNMFCKLLPPVLASDRSYLEGLPEKWNQITRPTFIYIYIYIKYMIVDQNSFIRERPFFTNKKNLSRNFRE